MANKTNSHVERLHRYLPFDASHDQIYEEYQRTDDTLNLKTRALSYLVSAVESGAKLIILTGDAGHGKTHLCRRLLEIYFDYSQGEARKLIKNSCNGSMLIGEDSGKIPLKIYKDFSEMTVNVASEHIEQAADSDSATTTIICANEGRLRAVLEYGQALPGSSQLLERFRESFKDGLSSNDGKTHIVNLNFQSVASNREKSLIKMASKSWTDGKRWGTCQDCDSREGCPILFNRQQLSVSTSDLAEVRLERIELLFATVERLGGVITIREVLMALAYFLTSGLTCMDVHRKLKRKKQGWQHNYVFYNSLFQSPSELSSDNIKKIPVLSSFSQLDLGQRAIREVDEMLINEQGVFEEGSLDLHYIYTGSNAAIHVDAANGVDEITGSPQSKKERINEANFVQHVIRALRRKLYFEASPIGVMAKLGFEFGDEFLEIIAGDMPAASMKAVKNRIISGLHTIQGIQMGTKETMLHIVDPFFFKYRKPCCYCRSQNSNERNENITNAKGLEYR